MALLGSDAEAATAITKPATAARTAPPPDGGGGKPDGSHPKGDSGSGSDTGSGSESGPGNPDGGKPDSSVPVGASVLQQHLNPTRDGHYIDPLMTKAYAANMAPDTSFDGTIGGPLWGQPLYVENGVGGKGTYYIGDDSNNVYALDETTGKPVWSKTPLAMAAGQAGSGCGNISPVGITGTPIIDLKSRTMYLAAAVGVASGIQSHEIYALSIDDGSTVAGWPIDVNNIVSSSPSPGGTTFNPPPQEERSALSLVNGYLYVPYGGEDGDCGNYHGWVVSVPVADPTKVTAYATPGSKGGIWAAGGMSSDGTDVFAGTGNCSGTDGLTWAQAGSEAVMRFHDGSAFDPTKTTDFFTPSNWQQLDDSDKDLAGTGPVVVDVPGATPSALIVQLGKSGVLHILDRSNLGGQFKGNGTTGEGIYSDKVANGEIKTTPATYTTSTGTYVVFHADGNGSSCPSGSSGDLIAVKITATSPPTFTTVWCAPTNGNAAPIVTTTDASGSNAIVWVVGAEGSNQVYGWDGETGASIFNGNGTNMDQVIHFSTLIDVKGRLVVGSNDKVYAFKGK